MEAQLIALKRKAASWGANEDEESITGFQGGRWEALSNWFPATVVWSGKQYPSVEHAFQAAKAAAEPERAEEISKVPTPKEAHALGQTVALPPGWERRRIKLMETLLRDKFRRDATLRERLLRTESKNLIANNAWGEAFWGVSGGNGSNELGKLLMALRDEARTGDDVTLAAQLVRGRGRRPRSRPDLARADAQGRADQARPHARRGGALLRGQALDVRGAARAPVGQPAARRAAARQGARPARRRPRLQGPCSMCMAPS